MWQIGNTRTFRGGKGFNTDEQITLSYYIRGSFITWRLLVCYLPFFPGATTILSPAGVSIDVVVSRLWLISPTNVSIFSHMSGEQNIDIFTCCFFLQKKMCNNYSLCIRYSFLSPTTPNAIFLSNLARWKNSTVYI